MSEKKLLWQVTPWVMNGKGGWTQQPVITIEGEIPFFGGHPNDYIGKLTEMHDDPQYARGIFYTVIGQLRDGLELAWMTDNKEVEKSTCCLRRTKNEKSRSR